MYNPSIKKSQQLKVVKKIDKNVTEKTEIKPKDIKLENQSFKSPIAMNWFRNMDLIVGNLSYDSKK